MSVSFIKLSAVLSGCPTNGGSILRLPFSSAIELTVCMSSCLGHIVNEAAGPIISVISSIVILSSVSFVMKSQVEILSGVGTDKSLRLIDESELAAADASADAYIVDCGIIKSKHLLEMASFHVL